MKTSPCRLYGKLQLTSVFRGVLQTPVVAAFMRYASAPSEEKPYLYGEFVSRVYAVGGNLTQAVKSAVFEDENPYIKGIAKKQEALAEIKASALRELSAFSLLASLTPADFAEEMGLEEGEIPHFASESVHLEGEYTSRSESIEKYGYGMFASHGMFRVSDDKKIEPVVSQDKVRLESFVGYGEERAKVIENTRAFLSGKPAANALLYGDAGTGKSSTVKAVANAFFEEGLRLIEIRKDQLKLLPTVMAQIADNPLKFIVFIDDLSFRKEGDDFSMLKAALEGSASATADNAVIYATSNRRHIVRESFSDRDGDDVHRNDSLQESLSLSERFGLVVSFLKPNKTLYLSIVKELATRYGVEMPDQELEVQAEAFALRKGNRSARCAQQFILSLL